MELVWNGIKELVESGWSAVMVMKKSKNGSCDSDTWITARCEKEEDNGMYEDLRAVIPRKLQPRRSSDSRARWDTAIMMAHIANMFKK